MNYPRYIVLDDAPHGTTLGLTADQFAEALRPPLAAIGVRVVRQHGLTSERRAAGFQARGCPRNLYFAKLDKVERVVTSVMTRSPAQSFDVSPPASPSEPMLRV
jgi:hypothetical protein